MNFLLICRDIIGEVRSIRRARSAICGRGDELGRTGYFVFGKGFKQPKKFGKKRQDPKVNLESRKVGRGIGPLGTHNNL